MKQEFSPQIPDFQQIRERLFKIAKDGGGHFIYANIRKKLDSLISNGYKKQGKEIAIDILKIFTHRPALTWELKRLLNADEIKQFENWRKDAKPGKPRAKCPTCGSYKIARIQYGFPMFDKKTERQIELGIIVLGGCCERGDRYKCMNCERQFVKRPIEDEHFPNDYDNGKIIVKSENNKQIILVNIQPTNIANV